MLNPHPLVNNEGARVAAYTMALPKRARRSCSDFAKSRSGMRKKKKKGFTRWLETSRDLRNFHPTSRTQSPRPTIEIQKSGADANGGVLLAVGSETVVPLHIQWWAPTARRLVHSYKPRRRGGGGNPSSGSRRNEISNAPRRFTPTEPLHPILLSFHFTRFIVA